MNLNTISSICNKVYNQLGKGCSEASYQRALEIELQMNHHVCVIREYYLNLYYNNICVSTVRPDLVITDWNLLIECKAVSKLQKKDYLQCEQYKRLSNGMDVVLVNFGHNNLELKLI